MPPVTLPDDVVAVALEYADGVRTPVLPRDAATVILLAPAEAGDAGPLVYYLRRQVTMEFAGGMCVYPGGGVDPRDFDTEVAWAGPTPAQWAARLGCDEELARALVCAAVRETFEESGVLLAGTSPTSVVADTTGEDWEADRVALETRAVSMTDFLVRRGLVLRTDLLGAWDAWTTPVFEPRRYQTWFFVASMPPGQRTRDVSSESSSVTWLSARSAVEEADAGRLALMPPTYLTSLEVAGFTDPGAVLAEAAARVVQMHTPDLEPSGAGYTLSVPERLRPLIVDRAAGAAGSAEDAG